MKSVRSWIETISQKQMKTNKQLGVWMDHSSANLIAFKDPMTCLTIESGFTHNKKVDALHKSEMLMHNIERQMQETYYQAIAEAVLKYDHVVLFGPTDAKSELFNYMKKDLHIKNIKIDVESTDKMTENEKLAFVREHFEKH